ncbi:MAG: chromosome partitioning protein ParB, partial [Spirochaetales bacterium]
LKETGLTQDDVAKKVGKNRSTIANSLRLLKMPGEMLEALNSGDITAGHARAILSVVNPARQQGLFNLIMREGMSVRKAEEQAARLNLGQTGTAEKETAAKPAKKREPELAEFEQKLLERFGTKAEIHGSLSSGRIVLHFYSMEDLDRLINELMING